MRSPKPRAVAHLIEIVTRSAFVSDGVQERHLTDWPALRLFNDAPHAARTEAVLADFLGLSRSMTVETLNRLIDHGAICRIDEDHYEVTAIGRAHLSIDPLNVLTNVLATLPEESIASLAGELELVAAHLAYYDHGSGVAAGSVYELRKELEAIEVELSNAAANRQESSLTLRERQLLERRAGELIVSIRKLENPDVH